MDAFYNSIKFAVQLKAEQGSAYFFFGRKERECLLVSCNPNGGKFFFGSWNGGIKVVEHVALMPGPYVLHGPSNHQP